jgi:thiazole synthase
VDERSTIVVQVNGKSREIAAGLSVGGLLESLGLNPALVVVERNREILARSSHTQVILEGGDVLEFVHFVGGG